MDTEGDGELERGSSNTWRGFDLGEERGSLSIEAEWGCDLVEERGGLDTEFGGCELETGGLDIEGLFALVEERGVWTQRGL